MSPESPFSEQFARSSAIYDAIRKVVEASRADGGVIDPAMVVTELIENYPDTSAPPAALLEQVVRAASEAGLPLTIRSAE